MSRVTEIIPSNIPNWMQKGIDEGNLFQVMAQRDALQERKIETAIEALRFYANDDHYLQRDNKYIDDCGFIGADNGDLAQEALKQIGENKE